MERASSISILPPASGMSRSTCCHIEGLWMHVDDAHDVHAVLSPRYQDRLQGLLLHYVTAQAWWTLDMRDLL